MKICTKQETVVHDVRAILRERSNVNGLKGRQRVLARHGSGSLVRIGDRNPECTLAKAWSDDDW